MKSHYCSICGVEIVESDQGYMTGCPHYPIKSRGRVHSEPPPKHMRHLFPDNYDDHIDEDEEMSHE